MLYCSAEIQPTDIKDVFQKAWLWGRSKHNCAGEERCGNVIVDIGLWDFAFGKRAIPAFEQTRGPATMRH